MSITNVVCIAVVICFFLIFLFIVLQCSLLVFALGFWGPDGRLAIVK